MALAKDQTNSSSFYGNMLEHGSSIQFPYIDPYVLDEYIQKHDHQDDLDSPRSYKITSNINHIMNLSGGNSGFQPHEEVHSLLTFKSGVENIVHNSETSLLSFHQGEHRHYQLWQGCSSISSNNSTNLSVMDEASCLQTTSKNYRDEANEWLFHETTLVDPTLECGTQRTSSFNKRPQMEENMHGLKKQCIISPSKKIAKPKSSTSKDPQSIAAKNRRERISERLKILQDLVPNGSKVDLVTMLEKAINYVKFLQLQVKVLAADEFWPEAGGKAPDISQVREAIDAILTSQRTDRSSTSSNS